MNIKIEKNNFVQHFKNRKSFTNEEIFSYFREIEHGIKRSTVNWRIYSLISQGILVRTARGIYELGSEKKFIHQILGKQKQISSEIKKNFPLVSYCLWNISAIKEFSQHIFNAEFLIIEVEREAVSSVYNSIKEFNINTFNNPSQDFMEEFVLSAGNSIIVKPLVSESPLISVIDIPVPSLEKILVDLVADTDIFFFLQGSEMLNIFGNAVEKYTINSDKLLRYAKRRGKDNKIRELINQINGNNK